MCLRDFTDGSRVRRKQSLGAFQYVTEQRTSLLLVFRCILDKKMRLEISYGLVGENSEVQG